MVDFGHLQERGGFHVVAGGAFPHVLGVLHGSGVLALGVEHLDHVFVDVVQVGIQVQGVLELGDGLVVPAGHQVDLAKAVMRVGMVRVELGVHLQMLDRQVVLVDVRVGVSQEVMRLAHVGGQLQGPLEALGGERLLVDGGVEDPGHVERHRIVAVLGHELFELEMDFLNLFLTHAPFLGKPDPDLLGRRGAGHQGIHPGLVTAGFIVQAPEFHHIGHEIVGHEMVRVQLQGLPECVFRRFEPTFHVVFEVEVDEPVHLVTDLRCHGPSAGFHLDSRGRCGHGGQAECQKQAEAYSTTHNVSSTLIPIPTDCKLGCFDRALDFCHKQPTRPTHHLDDIIILYRAVSHRHESDRTPS